MATSVKTRRNVRKAASKAAFPRQTRRGVTAGDSVACAGRSTRDARRDGPRGGVRATWFDGCRKRSRNQPRPHTAERIVVKPTLSASRPEVIVAAITTTLAVLTLSGPARAQGADMPYRPRSLDPQPFEQSVSATTWGIAGYHLGRGIGARMTLPAADGLLRTQSISDVFALDIGADYLRFRDEAPAPSAAHALASNASASILRPVAGLLWAFRLGDRLALYPKLELGWNVPRSDARDPTAAARYAGIHVEGIAGLLVSLGRLSLRAESGWGYLKAGLGFTI
jgi:hypothetical protein